MDIKPLQCEADIPPEYRQNPVGELIRYHNLGAVHKKYRQPEILIGKCMDYRVQLRTPPAFAYKLRSGGCNLNSNDFQVAYAVAVGGVKAIALIGHTDCGMVRLEEKREKFIQGFLTQSDCTHEEAASFFDQHAAANSLCRESDILFEEANRYRSWFPRLPVAVMLYKVNDSQLYLLNE
ncbi:carbonic anhydrase [Dethiobacter alkaliphilus]|uniref:carbonic anhydrase n=1 Tax=Dethiobacter alkaliphilus TaxID=427926 RepID=UPI002227A61C|nr:carbonic anhydrase [Dethiobacter alkaliphilus]MCW3489183.1 carbonic anhydrase [Dethiobacter alkaliphilus]